MNIPVVRPIPFDPYRFIRESFSDPVRDRESELRMFARGAQIDQINVAYKMRRGWSRVIIAIDAEARAFLSVPIPAEETNPAAAYIRYRNGDREPLVHQMSRIRQVGGKVLLREVWAAVRAADADSDTLPFESNKEAFVPPAEYTLATWKADLELGPEEQIAKEA